MADNELNEITPQDVSIRDLTGTTYSASHKRYYEANKEKIRAYYQKNKEYIRNRTLLWYYRKMLGEQALREQLKIDSPPAQEQP